MKKTASLNTKQSITALGKAELQKKLAKLKHERTKLIDEMRELTSQSGAGIGLEDSLRTLQRDRVDELDTQIQNVGHIINTAKVIMQPSSNNKVQVGSRVTIEIDEKPRTYTIVGSIEANPELGRISYESPLGSALLGRRVHERFEVTRIARRAIVAKVIAIE